MIQKFCCCCHLRTSAIVYAWLQVMGCIFTITGIIIPLDYYAKLIGYESNKLDSHLSHYYSRSINKYIEIQPGLLLVVAEQIIKIVTCFLLIWGIFRRQHFYMQPWLFLQCFENVIISLGLIVYIVFGAMLPVLFIGIIPCCVIPALGWYFWFCVREVYKQDHINSAYYWREYSKPLVEVVTGNEFNHQGMINYDQFLYNQRH